MAIPAQVTHEQYNNKLFQRYAPYYNLLSRPSLLPIRLKIRNQLPLPEYTKVIDIACGTGLQAYALARSGHKVVGIDLSPAMIHKAKRKAVNGLNVSFICADATKIPYPNGFFDASILCFALHDMPEDVGLTVLEEMKRVTRRGGKIIIADYNCHSTHMTTAKLSHRLSKLFESKYYSEFMKRGILHYLKKKGLAEYTANAKYRGIVQIVCCQNT
jgi:ubiquinone/menaquinone biosynthesis C-methylase UbiE